MFGTDGIRGRVGVEPLTGASLERLGYAIGAWAVEKYGASPHLLVGHDTRVSSGFVKAALKLGLLRHRVRLVDAYVMPTPAIVLLLNRDAQFDFGIVISASHNPYYDNGIKLVDVKTGKISAQDEARIVELFGRGTVESYESLGDDAPCTNSYERYITLVSQCFPSNFLAGKKIVLDCAHGAAYKLAPLLFARMGAQVISINDQPNGMNINKNCGALYPEGLQKAVLDYQADAGFSFDGDADRVIAVSSEGTIKDGDDILALLLQHPRYASSLHVVGTIMSNQALECHLSEKGVAFCRAKVGDKYVARMMLESDVLLGGEPSGHIIVRDYLTTGDGLFVALLVCETLQYKNSWCMGTFAKFPQVLLNVAVEVRRDLQEPEIEQIITDSRQRLHHGRLIVRYSGTEALLRIMIEDDDYEHALLIGTLLSKQLKEKLS